MLVVRVKNTFFPIFRACHIRRLRDLAMGPILPSRQKAVAKTDARETQKRRKKGGGGEG